jgi:hypothetical protein
LEATMSRWRNLCVLVGLAAASSSALAHETLNNLIELKVDAVGHVDGRWEIPVADIEDLWPEVSRSPEERVAQARAHEAPIVAAVHDDLALAAGDDETCAVQWGAMLMAEHQQQPYVSLPFTASCPAEHLRAIELKWTFLNEAEHKHQALVSFLSPGGPQSAIVGTDAPTLKLGMVGEDGWKHARMYVADGILHIWTGIDHILFLLTLILPAVFFLDRREWQARERFRDTGLEIVKTVSAFTIAHSLTLCLVTFHLLHLPSRLVESVIAFSVLLAGLNNLFPVLHEGRWKLAFLFGLVHGIGFAEVLVDLQLPTSALVNSLVSFNVGVEIGQLAIVAAALPPAFALRRTFVYRRVVFLGGSAAASLVAALWLVDRALGLAFMPF